MAYAGLLIFLKILSRKCKKLGLTALISRSLLLDLGYSQDTFTVVKYVSEYLMKQFLWECALIVL